MFYFWHSANHLFAECYYFPECFSCSARQRACLPSARRIALGKQGISSSESFWKVSGSDGLHAIAAAQLERVCILFLFFKRCVFVLVFVSDYNDGLVCFV